MLAAPVKAYGYRLDGGAQILHQLGYVFRLWLCEGIGPLPTHEVSPNCTQFALFNPRTLQGSLDGFRLFQLFEAQQDCYLHAPMITHETDHRDITVARAHRGARLSAPRPLVRIVLQARQSPDLLQIAVFIHGDPPGQRRSGTRTAIKPRAIKTEE